MSNEATVILIDDDEAVLQSLRWLIEPMGYHIITYASPNIFLESEFPNTPTCLILDIRMPDMSGLTLQDKLIARKFIAPIIFLTGHGDIPMAVQAMKKGAFDFYVKPANNQLLLDAINRAIAVSTKHITEMQRYQLLQTRKARLTPREREVMGLMVQGHKTVTIAEKLAISANTVELHRMKVLKKMEVKSIVELVRSVLTANEPVTSWQS